MPGGAFDVIFTIHTAISGIIFLEAPLDLVCAVAVSTFLIGHKSTLTHLWT